jgi:ABC-type transport system substrate-binding protein
MTRSYVCALASALVLLGCGGPREDEKTEPAANGAPAAASQAPEDEGPAVRGDWIVLHSLADPENLNPLTSNDAGASAVLGWIFPPLIRVDPATLDLAPMLAKALPEVSDDKLTYTYSLRDDVTFSDGAADRRGRSSP